MKRSRRVDAPSIFYFCLVPILRKVTTSATQQKFRNINDFQSHCTQNPSISQPKMSHCTQNPSISNLVILAITHNWKWAPDVRFLKISFGNLIRFQKPADKNFTKLFNLWPRKSMKSIGIQCGRHFVAWISLNRSTKPSKILDISEMLTCSRVRNFP